MLRRFFARQGTKRKEYRRISSICDDVLRKISKQAACSAVMRDLISAYLKRMSKGMKQKTAIVAALMGDKEILIMDEPMTGLDPLMRETFLELVREEKNKGRTIFMSSHIFEEIEDVCDRVAIIGNGKIEDILSLSDLRHGTPRNYKIVFGDRAAAEKFASAMPEAGISGNQANLSILASETDKMLKAINNLDVISIDESHENLEQYFMNIYREEEKKE